jgi:hypothetical protein
MKVKELKAFLSTLPDDTEVMVCNVLDGDAERLPIQSVLLTGVLPAVTPLQSGGVVFLCTWHPLFVDATMTFETERNYKKRRVQAKQLPTQKHTAQKIGTPSSNENAAD